MTPQKTIDPIDAYVGKRVRAQRLARDHSQTTLAEALGITFQQVQKYENGMNRISCSRLVAIARFLNVRPSFFFEGLPEDGAAPSEETQASAAMMATRHGAEICKIWPQLEATGMTPLIMTVAQLSLSAAGSKQAA